jgi:hypothetical protein
VGTKCESLDDIKIDIYEIEELIVQNKNIFYIQSSIFSDSGTETLKETLFENIN